MERRSEVLIVDGEEISYTLRRGGGAKNLRITLRPNGAITVSAPAWVALREVRSFLVERADWIKQSRARMGVVAYSPELAQEQYRKHRTAANAVIAERVSHFASLYGVSYKSVTIRDQSTRWGSCSARGALNFNYRVALLPPDLMDYVIAHEICHLIELNHSVRFWAQVARTVPDYRSARLLLKRHRVY